MQASYSCPKDRILVVPGESLDAGPRIVNEIEEVIGIAGEVFRIVDITDIQPRRSGLDDYVEVGVVPDELFMEVVGDLIVMALDAYILVELGYC